MEVQQVLSVIGIVLALFARIFPPQPRKKSVKKSVETNKQKYDQIRHIKFRCDYPQRRNIF